MPTGQALPATHVTVGRVGNDIILGGADVDVRETEKLRAIIASVPDMMEMLRDTVAVLQAEFGSAATIAIEPLEDPEAIDIPPLVFVFAVTSLPFEQADAILERVIEGWWSRITSEPRVE